MVTLNQITREAQFPLAINNGLDALLDSMSTPLSIAVDVCYRNSILVMIDSDILPSDVKSPRTKIC